MPRWQIEAQGNFPPLVENATFQRVQALLANMSPTVTAKQRNHPDFPLRGFVRCGSCGRPLTGSWSKGRSARYAYYRCPAPRCNAVNVDKRTLERQFLELLDGLRPDQEYLALFSAIVLDVWRDRRSHVTERRAELERRTQDLKARKELDVEAVLEFARHLILNAAQMWIQASLDQRQRLQGVLFPEGLTYADGAIGTAVTCPIFSYLDAVPGAVYGLVSPTGFEPVLPP